MCDVTCVWIYYGRAIIVVVVTITSTSTRLVYMDSPRRRYKNDNDEATFRARARFQIRTLVSVHNSTDISIQHACYQRDDKRDDVRCAMCARKSTRGWCGIFARVLIHSSQHTHTWSNTCLPTHVSFVRVCVNVHRKGMRRTNTHAHTDIRAPWFIKRLDRAVSVRRVMSEWFYAPTQMTTNRAERASWVAPNNHTMFVHTDDEQFFSLFFFFMHDMTRYRAELFTSIKIAPSARLFGHAFSK